MLNNLFTWTKNNKIVTLVLILLSFLTLKSYIRNRVFSPMYGLSVRSAGSLESAGAPTTMMFDAATDDFAPSFKAVGMRAPVNTPIANTLDRKVVTNSNFSLQVKSVTETANNIKNKVAELGGYPINTTLNRPEFGEDASIDVRIPNTKFEEFTTFLRSQAMKVVSEYTTGNDITDSYVDTQDRITQLTIERAMLDNILKKAVTVDDIMKVRPYIQQIQQETDALKGQLQFMDGTTSTTLVTIFLATDELSLPYAPANTWRPEVIFKTAVRSLIGTMQDIGSTLIWLGVYSIIIVPALVIVLIAVIVRNRKKTS